MPTPGLSSILYAWDKREVYRLAERLSIPAPRTWFPQSEKDLAAIEVDEPVVLKPAIKEHFFYATHAKGVAGRHRQRSCWPPSAGPRRSCRPARSSSRK